MEELDGKHIEEDIELLCSVIDLDSDEEADDFGLAGPTPEILLGPDIDPEVILGVRMELYLIAKKKVDPKIPYSNHYVNHVDLGAVQLVREQKRKKESPVCKRKRFSKTEKQNIVSKLESVSYTARRLLLYHDSSELGCSPSFAQKLWQGRVQQDSFVDTQFGRKKLMTAKYLNQIFVLHHYYQTEDRCLNVVGLCKLIRGECDKVSEERGLPPCHERTVENYFHLIMAMGSKQVRKPEIHSIRRTMNKRSFRNAMSTFAVAHCIQNDVYKNLRFGFDVTTITYGVVPKGMNVGLVPIGSKSSNVVTCKKEFSLPQSLKLLCLANHTGASAPLVIICSLPVSNFLKQKKKTKEGVEVQKKLKEGVGEEEKSQDQENQENIQHKEEEDQKEEKVEDQEQEILEGDDEVEVEGDDEAEVGNVEINQEDNEEKEDIKQENIPEIITGEIYGVHPYGTNATPSELWFVPKGTPWSVVYSKFMKEKFPPFLEESKVPLRKLRKEFGDACLWVDCDSCLLEFFKDNTEWCEAHRLRVGKHAAKYTQNVQLHDVGPEFRGNDLLAVLSCFVFLSYLVFFSFL